MPSKSKKHASTHYSDAADLCDLSFKNLITASSKLSNSDLLALQSTLYERRTGLVESTKNARGKRQFTTETSLLFAKLVGVSVMLHARDTLKSPGWDASEDKVKLKATLGMALDLATQAERGRTYITDEKRCSATSKSVRWCNIQLKAAEQARTGGE